MRTAPRTPLSIPVPEQIFSFAPSRVQTDGKVLIGGDFTLVDNVERRRIARLNPDGSLDVSFDPGNGADSYVEALAVQSDGKVLIGGAFTKVAGVDRKHIARLNPDGSVDTAFDTSTGADDTVFDLAVQPDGKVIIGGDFIMIDNVERRRITRLNGATPPVITSRPPGSGQARRELPAHLHGRRVSLCAALLPDRRQPPPGPHPGRGHGPTLRQPEGARQLCLYRERLQFCRPLRSAERDPGGRGRPPLPAAAVKERSVTIQRTKFSQIFLVCPW